MTSQTQKIEIPELHWDLYEDETPVAVVRFFEKQIYIVENIKKIPILFQAYRKWRIHYGDRQTGASWNTPDEGFIGVGAATEQTPRRYQEETVLSLFKTPKAKTGQPIMVRCVVKIEAVTDDKIEYRHPDFHIPEEKVKSRPEEKQTTNNTSIFDRTKRGVLVRRIINGAE